MKFLTIIATTTTILALSIAADSTGSASYGGLAQASNALTSAPDSNTQQQVLPYSASGNSVEDDTDCEEDIESSCEEEDVNVDEDSCEEEEEDDEDCSDDEGQLESSCEEDDESSCEEDDNEDSCDEDDAQTSAQPTDTVSPDNVQKYGGQAQSDYVPNYANQLKSSEAPAPQQQLNSAPMTRLSIFAAIVAIVMFA